MNDEDNIKDKIEDAAKTLFNLLKAHSESESEEGKNGEKPKWASIKFDDREDDKKHFMCVVAENEADLVKAGSTTAIFSRTANGPSFELAKQNLECAMTILLENGITPHQLIYIFDEILSEYVDNLEEEVMEETERKKLH